MKQSNKKTTNYSSKIKAIPFKKFLKTLSTNTDDASFLFDVFEERLFLESLNNYTIINYN